MSRTQAFLTALESDCSSVITGRDLVAGYARDAAPFSPYDLPLAVVRARTEDDVVAAVRLAAEHGVPVVPQGSRTGLSGGANGIAEGIVVSTELMNRILSIDAAAGIAVVEPGVVNAELSRRAADLGLYYPPDPSSWESCTIGGNIATNAGGLCCLKYGVTGTYVLGLEAVLGTGELLRTGRATRKGVAGYDLTHLLVGSEGTLGVITKAVVSLRPRPSTALTMVATFATTAAAAGAIAALSSQPVTPSMLEIMDRAAIGAVNAYRDMGLPEDAAAMVIAQSDDPHAAAAVEGFAGVCRTHGAADTYTAEHEDESEMLLAARRLVGPAVFARGATLIEDVCVPVTRLAELMSGVEEIGARLGAATFVTGHAGDGNMHPLIQFDEHDAEQTVAARKAFGEIMELALALGGTITGEHGVGQLKREWLATEIGELGLRLHRQIKQVFDPAGILNPGRGF